MNSTKSFHFPIAVSGAPISRLIRNCKRLFQLALCLLGFQASAQNLILNSDFEAGQLAPWSGGQLWPNPSGGICARIGDFIAGNGISQIVPTVAGQRYLLSADLRSETQSPAALTMIAQAQSGDIDGARDVGLQGAFQRFTLLFTATAAPTSIELRGSLGQFVLIDNVSLVAVPPAADKSYMGMLVTTITVTEPALSTKSSRKVAARLNAAGDLVLLDGTDAIITGSIQPTGEFSLILPGNFTVTGTAVVRGRRIKLEYMAGSHAASNVHGQPVANTITQSLTLTRR